MTKHLAKPTRQKAPTGIRLPDDLHQWLRRRAEVNSRNLTQEILHRLKASRALEEQQGAAQ